MRSTNSKAVYFIEMFAHFFELQAARVIFIHKCESKLCAFISDIFRKLLQHKFELTQTKISLFGILKIAKHSLQGEVVLQNYFVEFLETLFYFYPRDLLLVYHIVEVANCESQAQSVLVGRIADGDSILF